VIRFGSFEIEGLRHQRTSALFELVTSAERARGGAQSAAIG